MGSPQQVRLVLETSLDREGSISGSVAAERGEPRRFSGWLGLTAAITELAEGAGAGSPERERGPRGLLDQPEPDWREGEGGTQ